MCLQRACIRGCKVTLVALVWLFSTVRFQMCPQMLCIGRCIVTLVAFIYNKPNFIHQSRQISTMIDCQKTYDARNARNSSLLKLPNAEWTGPERCIHEHIEFSSCNKQILSNYLATFLYKLPRTCTLHYIKYVWYIELLWTIMKRSNCQQ